MAKVKLGSKEFNVDSEEIDADSCGVPAADLALFAARVKTGEISRVKKLYLVIFFLFLFLLCIFRVLFAALCASADVRCAGRQPNRRRRRKIDCSSRGRKQQLAGAGPCEMKFWVFFLLLNFRFFFYRGA